MKENSRPNKVIIYILKATLFCLVFTGLFIILSFPKSSLPDKFERIAHGTIGTIAAILTTFLFVKFDKKTFADIGFVFEKTSLTKFFSGVLLGITVMGILTLSVIFFSYFKIETNSNSNILNFLLWTLPLIPLAFMEEVGFRAYPLRILKDKVGLRNSIIITSLLFALYHVVNGWTLQNSFLGAGVWGIIFGLTAIYSNGISMPTGLHYATNLTTSAFGISEGSFNLWVLKTKDGLTLENYQSSQLTTLIPQISLLVFALICMEWYVRKKTNANTGIANNGTGRI
jgi:membrane protease YdiL (CAAX protease family)